MPPQRGAGRVDVPDHPVLYLASAPTAAVAEVFGDLDAWSPDMFVAPSLARAQRALGTYELAGDARIADLDDAATLQRLGIRPTEVVSEDRAVTQAWARRLLSEGDWAGVRWWSRASARWYIYGIWRIGTLAVRAVEVLTIAHPAVVDAAARLKRTVRAR